MEFQQHRPVVRTGELFEVQTRITTSRSLPLSPRRSFFVIVANFPRATPRGDRGETLFSLGALVPDTLHPMSGRLV